MWRCVKIRLAHRCYIRMGGCCQNGSTASFFILIAEQIAIVASYYFKLLLSAKVF